MKPKPAMRITTETTKEVTARITTSILLCALAAGWAVAQNPSVVQNVRSTTNGVSQNQTAASNEALGIKQSSAKPAATQNTGAAVVTPAKSSAPGAPSAAQSEAKKNFRRKRVAAVAVLPGGQTKPDGAVSKSVPEASVTGARNGAAGEEGIQGGNQAEPAVDSDSKAIAKGRRDPFLSPVVNHVNSPGCSAGKKCLDIGTISLRGVVHSDNGFIAVVSNGLNKAYFLRENDPVFNGYVMKITGDSIVFRETLQDRLGKNFTREVVKKITTPAV